MKKNIQLSHADHRPGGGKFSLSLVAHDITDPLNVGSLFRLSDALGVEKLYLCGRTPTPPDSRINKTARSTVKYVEHTSCSSAEALITSLKSSGVFIVALEITSSSIAISSDNFTKQFNNKKPVCLILGSENTGVSESLLSLTDMTIHIPMFGNNSSMNVVSAASIACFEITRMITGK